MKIKTVSGIMLAMLLLSFLNGIQQSLLPWVFGAAELSVSFIEVGENGVFSTRSPAIRLSVTDSYGNFVPGVEITVTNPPHLPNTYYDWLVTERTSDYVVKANGFPFFAIRDDFLFTFEKSGFNTKFVFRELAINAPFIDFVDENGAYRSDSKLQFNMEALPSYLMVYNSFQTVFVDSTKYHVATAYQSDYGSEWLNSYVVLDSNYFMVSDSETCDKAALASYLGPRFSVFPTETLSEMADLANQMIWAATWAYVSGEFRDLAAEILGMAIGAYVGSVISQVANAPQRVLDILNNYKGIQEVWAAFAEAHNYIEIGSIATKTSLLLTALINLDSAGHEFLALKDTISAYQGTTRYQYDETNDMFETWFHASSNMLMAAEFIENILPYEEWCEQLDDVFYNILEGISGVPIEDWLGGGGEVLQALLNSLVKYCAVTYEFYGRRWREEAVSATLRQKIQNTGQTQIIISIPSADDFRISAYYVSTQTTSATVFAGLAVTFTVDVELVSGSVPTVSLSLSGHDGTMSVSFNPQSATPPFSSSLTISTSGSTSGRFVLTVYGSSGDMTRNSRIVLEVLNPPPAGSAITIAPLNSATGTILYGAYTRYHGAVDPYYNGREVWLAQSVDGGQTWYSAGQYIPTSDNKWYYPSSMTVVPIWLSAWLGVDHPCTYLMKAGIHGTVLESNIISFTMVKAPTSAEISVTPDIIVEEETLTVTGVISSTLGISGSPYTCEGTWYVDWRQESGSWNVLASGTVSAQYEIPPDGGPYSILFNIPTQTWTPPNSGNFGFRLRYSGDNNYEASTSEEEIVSVEPSTYPITVFINGLPSSNITHLFIDNVPVDILSGGSSGTYEVSLERSHEVSVNSTISFGSNTRYVSSPMWQMVSEPGYYNFTYHKEYKLTVEVAPIQSGRVELTGSTWFDSGIIVEARSRPNATFTFYHWAVDNAYAGSSGNLSLTMNTSHTLEAFFALAGDVNRDGQVDASDLLNWSEAYGSDPSKPNWNSTCDFDNDGKVDVYDLSELGRNYGRALENTLFEDNFDYETVEEMVSAGWTVGGESMMDVGEGVVTLDNDGSAGSSVYYDGNFPSGILSFEVETEGMWIGRSYGTLQVVVKTERHGYIWMLDGYYPEYAFIRDGVKVLRFGGYTPQKDVWMTIGLKKEGNIFYLYHNGELKNTYTEPDETPDPLFGVGISSGWISTAKYDYISVREQIPSG